MTSMSFDIELTRTTWSLLGLVDYLNEKDASSIFECGRDDAKYPVKHFLTKVLLKNDFGNKHLNLCRIRNGYFRIAKDGEMTKFMLRVPSLENKKEDASERRKRPRRRRSYYK